MKDTLKQIVEFLIKLKYKPQSDNGWRVFNEIYYEYELKGVLVYLWLCEIQRWLRGVHNIDVEPYLILMTSNNVEIKQDSDTKEYTYSLKHNGISQFVGNSGVKDTYEESLAVGVLEALKLI